MKRIAFPLLAGLMALAACTNDTLQELAPATPGDDTAAADGVPEGSFIVDYTVDGGPSTRAGGKLQVQTLDYYVYYSKTDTLVKKRRIEIEENQEFPLTRETMTWEQRQALQDTLDCGEEYHILFLANVDPALFAYEGYSNEEGGTPHPAIVIDDEQYSTARLLLPNVPFHEDNMYCLWEGKLSCATDAPDKVVKREDVLLQRVVTRTDIKRTDSPTTLYDAIAHGFYTTYEDAVANTVKARIKDFCDGIKDCSSYGYHVDYALDDYETEIADLTALLEKDDIQNKVVELCKKQLINQYVNSITSSGATDNIYATRTQAWYKEGRTAHAVYEQESRVNAIGFDRQAYYYNGLENEALCPMDSEGSLCLIGFADTQGQLNDIASLRFNEGATEAFTITGESFNTQQGINLQYTVTCDPAYSANFVGTETENKSINLKDIIISIEKEKGQNILTGNDGFVNAINDDFFDCYLNHVPKILDKRSLEDFPVNTDLPKITDVPNDIKLIPSWDIVQQ